MRLFGGERMQVITEKLGMDDSEPLKAGLLTKQIENAQKRIESRNYEIRKNVLKYDDVMNQQRTIIYDQRRQVLEGENMRETIKNMGEKLIGEAVDRFCVGENSAWNIEGLSDYLERLCIPRGTFAKNTDALGSFDRDGVIAFLMKAADDFYTRRESDISSIGIDMRELERNLLLRAVDTRWMDHIDAMDQLREGIGLRAYAQRDPVNEYKMESYDMFDEMVRLIQEDTLRQLFQTKISKPQKGAPLLGLQAKGAQVVQGKQGKHRCPKAAGS